MAYVIPRGTHTASPELGEEVRQHVATKLGAIARPKVVIFTDELPKTRSGKIMRRLLRDVAEGRVLGDTTTLADPNVVEEIKRRAAESPTEDEVTELGHWRWRDEPGRARARGRVRHGRRALRRAPAASTTSSGPRRDWDAFFDAVGEDALIAEVARLLDVLDPTLRDRAAHRPPDERAAPDARAGSREHDLRWDLLVMRDWGDYGAARDFKQDAVDDLRGHGFDLRLAFEDDRRNVEMFHRQGVPCVYIHSGYYD